jgi:hypothetical protein
MKRSGILDWRFWICTLLFGLLMPSLLSAATPTPTPTPTTRPRLSGGFGRAVSTPVVQQGTAGQSLADLVRAAEAARNKEPSEKKSGVKIDNGSLITDSAKGKAAAVRPPAAAVPVSRTPVAPGATAVPVASPAPSAEETRWRDAARNAAKRVEDAKRHVEELDAAAHKLETEFYAWDEGQYRDRVIKPDWDKTKDKLEAAKKELADAEKDLADLPEKAQRAGALPGWLRE